MKVVFVYRYLTLGGVEVVLRTRAIGLRELGIDATLWFLSDGPGRTLFNDGQARARVGGLADLGDHLRTEQPAVFSVIDTPEALTAVKGLAHRPAVVLEVHTPYAENRVYLRAGECALADVVFVPSEHQRRIVEREMSRVPRIEVLPNPVGDGFETPLGKVDYPPDCPVVAWAGRLDSLKNWRGFIRIMQGISRVNPRVEFWLAGSGSEDEEANLERACRKAHVLHHLRWYRGLPHSAMSQLYDAVRASGGVVVSTSRDESFGMVIAEAMARACAVVAPRTGPFPEFIGDGLEGLLYSQGRFDRATQAIENMLADPVARCHLGQRARARILESHGTAPSLRRLADALRGLRRQA